MIRHYDMTTGEEVGETIQHGSAQSAHLAIETESLRLMTVQESAALQGCDMQLPADMATLPVEAILTKWS